jgi:hypothetical protein
MTQIPVDPRDDLEGAVRTLALQAAAVNSKLDVLNSRLRRRTVAFVASIIVAGLVLGTAVAAAYQVSLNNQRAIRANNALFCPLISILIPPPGQAEPTTANGIRVVRAAQKLYDSDAFGCRQ